MDSSIKHLKKTFVLQKDTSDCGVACLLSVIKFYGGNCSLETIRSLSGTTKQGTSLLGLYEASNKLNFNAEGNETNSEELINYPNPIILHVTIDNHLEHYVVCYGYDNGEFIVGDPAIGITTYTQDYLDSIWESKYCLTLVPNEGFVKSKFKEKNKKEWFLNLLKSDSRLIWYSVSLGLCIAILGMAMSIFSQKLIDDILPSKDLDKLVMSILLLGFLLLVRVFLNALRDYFLIRQTKDFNNRIIDSFYTSLLNLPKLFFDTRKIGELVARLNDTERVQKVIKLVIENLVLDFLITLITLIFLFYYSWQTGLIALMSLPVYFLLIYSFNDKIIRAQKSVMQGYAINESNYVSSMRGIATIKNNNRQLIFKNINRSIYGNFQKKIFDLGEINLRLRILSGVFGVMFLIGILVYTSINVYYGKILLGELIAILGIASLLLPSVGNLALISIPINEAKIAFDRMYEFSSIEKENEGEESLKSFDSLVIENLSFRFPGSTELP